MDLSAYGKPSDATVLDAEVQEVTPAGTRVWSWSSQGHIDPAETGRWWDGLAPNRLPDGRDAYDYLHINSVEPDSDGLILSLRHTDAIYRISRSDGNVVWKLGGTTTAESLTVSGDPLGYTFGGQHDARREPDGTVTIHDNGTGLGRAPRAVRFQVDETTGTADLVESVSDPDVTVSLCCGSARRLDAGGWLVGWGNLGNPTVGGYAADGSPTFRLRVPDGFVYRAVPVPRSEVGAAQLRQGMDAMFPR